MGEVFGCYKISSDYLVHLIYEEVKQFGLIDYVDNVLIDSIDSRDGVVAVYGFSSNMNIKGGYIMLSSLYLDELNSHIVDRLSLIDSYFQVLKSVYHEITHVLQKKYLFENSDCRSFLYRECINFFVKNQESYFENYSYMPNEREANFYGAYRASKTLVEMFPLLNDYYEKTKIMRYVLSQFLFSDYSEKMFSKRLVSPLRKNGSFFKKVQDELKKGDFSHIDQLALGLDVSRDTYYHMKCNIEYGDVDRIVKKLSLVKR